MKRIFYILAAALVAGACAKTLELPFDPGMDGTEEGPKVTLTFSVPVDPQTKGAMAKDPVLDGDMYIAVFNKNQVLKEFVKAELEGAAPTQNGEEYKATFTAELTMSTGWRALHIIANCPVSEPTVRVGEAAVLNSFITENGEAAYWQRYELDNIDGYKYAGDKLGSHSWFTGGESSFTYSGTEGNYSYTYTSSGNTITVNPGDYIKVSGEKILTGEGYFASQDIQDKLALVPLVRNFARVLVAKQEGSNFIPKVFTLIYTPTAGFVAPNDNTKSSSVELSDYRGFVPKYFADAVQSNELTYEYVYDKDAPTHYFPGMPATATITNTGGDDDYPAYTAQALTGSRTDAYINVERTDDGDNAAYMYERSSHLGGQSATCILVGGEYTGASDKEKDDQGLTWFKIQLADADGNYFNIYRGVQYKIEIGKIEAVGYASPGEAFKNVPLGDVSNSPETSNLTSISDNKGTVLTVSYIDYVGMEQDGYTSPDNDGIGEYKILLYRLTYTDSEGNKTYPGNKVELSVSHPSSNHAVTVDADAITTGSMDGLDGGKIPLPSGKTIHIDENTTQDYIQPDLPDPDGGWWYAIVPLAAQDGNKYASFLTVKGPTLANENKTLERKVSYRVLGTQELTLSVSPHLSSEASGVDAKLWIKLPIDLGYSMFPLIFKIEAEQNNLNPKASENKDSDGKTINLPVETGASYFSGTPSFYFLYTVNYSDYYDASNGKYLDAIPLTFTTTKDWTAGGGSNETYISVTDKNGYFSTDPAKATVLVEVDGGNDYLKGSTTTPSVKSATTSASISVKAGSSTPWTASVTASDGSAVTLDKTSGTGSATLDVTFSEYTGATNRTFTVTLTSTVSGISTQTVTITQGKQQKTRTVTGSHTFNTNSTTYSSTTSATTPQTSDYVSLVFGSDFNALGTNYVQMNDNTTFTLSALNDATITAVTINYSAYNYGRSNSSSATPKTGSGSVYATNNGTTGTWTGSSASIVFTMRQYKENGKNGQTYLPRISSLEVTYSYSETYWE